MKHDLDAFSRDIVALIKTSGDTGGSGDKSKKSLRDNDFFVPGRPASLSPLHSDWGQDASASGDRKSERLQAVVERVPDVPAATTQSQGGLAVATQYETPADWYAILTELNRRDPVDWLSFDRWNEVVSDAEIFLTRWGNAALQLGWNALDLFGVHSAAPAAQVGCWGLILFVQGGDVVALTDSTATIRRRSSAVLTYRREPQRDRVLLSELAR